MQTLLLIYLFAVVCWARIDSNQENIETLMDNGISLFILYLIFPPQLSKICTNIYIYIYYSCGPEGALWSRHCVQRSSDLWTSIYQQAHILEEKW